jgi:hypothetical protein
VLADLETSLRQSFTPDNLAVYADYLQAQGDPRGELIALDLRQAQAPDAEIAAAIAKRVESLAGKEHRRLHQSVFRFGFIEELRLNDAWHGVPSEVLASVIASPLGPYIRAIRLSGGTIFLKYALAAVASVPRYEWLERLAIRQDTFAKMPKSPIATRAVTAAIIAATPRLETLEITGKNVFGTFEHPNVKTWTLSDVTSIKNH